MQELRHTARLPLLLMSPLLLFIFQSTLSCVVQSKRSICAPFAELWCSEVKHLPDGVCTIWEKGPDISLMSKARESVVLHC